MTVSIVVVYDVSCANCSRIARELPDVVRVPVRVRSCRDPDLGRAYPTLASAVRRCATPAIGAVREDGSVRWWHGLAAPVGLLPVVRRSPRAMKEAAGLLWTAVRTGR